MNPVSAEVSRALAGQSLIATALTLAHSWRTRGPRRTLLFAALGLGLPIVGEYLAVNQARLVRHHLQPQVQGVPLVIALGWYNIGYATFAVVESVLAPAHLPPATRRWALPALTALTATSLDLITDVSSLDQGWWEWRTGGPYAAEIAGPNGKHGIPLGNYAGWLLLTGGVTWLYLHLGGEAEPADKDSGAAGRVGAGRWAALMLLPIYLSSLAWAVQRRQGGPILYSLLAPLMIVWALRGRRAG